jgi:hypothetical protein
MNALYDYGYALGHDGYPWNKVPPGLEAAALESEPSGAPSPSDQVPPATSEPPR